MPLNIKPCHLRAARDYVSRHHRHSIPPVGGKFAVACYDGDRLCGVAICGRPVARHLDEMCIRDRHYGWRGGTIPSRRGHPQHRVHPL